MLKKKIVLGTKSVKYHPKDIINSICYGERFILLFSLFIVDKYILFILKEYINTIIDTRTIYIYIYIRKVEDY